MVYYVVLTIDLYRVTPKSLFVGYEIEWHENGKSAKGKSIQSRVLDILPKQKAIRSIADIPKSYAILSKSFIIL